MSLNAPGTTSSTHPVPTATTIRASRQHKLSTTQLIKSNPKKRKDKNRDENTKHRRPSGQEVITKKRKTRLSQDDTWFIFNATTPAPYDMTHHGQTSNATSRAKRNYHQDLFLRSNPQNHWLNRKRLALNTVTTGNRSNAVHTAESNIKKNQLGKKERKLERLNELMNESKKEKMKKWNNYITWNM